jgi:TolA-binding protein
MKAQERHHLKQNEFAIQAARVAESFSQNRSRITVMVVAAIVIATAVGGYFWWAKRTNDAASALLGQAMATAQAQIAPAPTLPGATQAAGTYPTEQARDEAALKAFQSVAAAYPSTASGLAAQYHVATTLMSLGRLPEAEQTFRDVTSRGGTSIYASMAKMGQVSALVGQSKFDDAIKLLTDMSADRDGALPIDGVLIELARTYVKAGKTQEARAAFKRVVDEFPQSTYAGDARQQLSQME